VHVQEKQYDNYCFQEAVSEDKSDETVGIHWYAYRIPGMIPYRMEQLQKQQEEKREQEV